MTRWLFGVDSNNHYTLSALGPSMRPHSCNVRIVRSHRMSFHSYFRWPFLFCFARSAQTCERRFTCGASWMEINYRDTSDIQMLGESKRKRGTISSCSISSVCVSVFVVPPPSSRSRIKESAWSENVDDLRYIYSNAITHGVAFIEFSAPFWSIFFLSDTHKHTLTHPRTRAHRDTQINQH